MLLILVRMLLAVGWSVGRMPLSIGWSKGKNASYVGENAPYIGGKRMDGGEECPLQLVGQWGRMLIAVGWGGMPTSVRCSGGGGGMPSFIGWSVGKNAYFIGDHAPFGGKNALN